jgi:hypothetical protein
MNLQQRINAFAQLRDVFLQPDEELDSVLDKTETHNPWFTRMHCELMLQNFAENYLSKGKLEAWAKKYGQLPEKNLTVGLVLAGNIPFVGMHDILSVLLCGYRAKIKLSSKDEYFFPYLHKKLKEANQGFHDKMIFAERLKDFDAIIATGSNNSARYFEHYFGKYPHIIRKNRTSIAVLTGNESEGEMTALGKDVFYYFGLGCRNVSKLYLPSGFEPQILFKIWDKFNYVIDNNKYKNNYDYNRALMLLNQVPHFANDFFFLTENQNLFSPLAILYFEYYTSKNDLEQKLNPLGENVQCIVAKADGNTLFGQTQFPELSDYADKADTMKFLMEIEMPV